ncbi:type I DNA topoisomerase [Candidatus Uhrbacteria bacterium]|nr:type I DNA topoisomerase [Candidatus Uhrbacteria bacterium]
MSHHLLIVESPTKAKTISKYLGQDYKVLSSFGHIRDLPKSKLGVDLENHFEPTYTIPPKSKKAVTELKAAAKNADMVYLATDEDREGEAIAWHIMEALKLKPENTRRITFHEITRSAVEEAVAHPRDIDQNLVNAQQARRILDRLVGYELSPFLWQKIRYGLSAGRVQSVAMRLIVERERERRAFNIEEYWTIDAEFEKAGIVFPAKLVEVDGKKLDKLDLKTQHDAKNIVDGLAGAPASVTAVEKKLVKKVAPTPLTTSTLQIDANTKLGFSSKATMKLAQDLYETGRITYMRTDSMNLAEKFLDEAQAYIRTTFGEKYAEGARRFKTNKKGAQEAHEAIRPTEVTATPDSLRSALEPRTWKLYQLIWSRTVASQLPAAQLNRTTVDILVQPTKLSGPTSPSSTTFRASGSSVAFPGFMKVYQSAKEKILPELAEGDAVDTKAIIPNQHFTEPPARYSDATLVKALEEFGIGRPSTYAPTISTIIDRGYVERDENKKLAPLDIALIVNDVLVGHFPQIVDYEFTAKMENSLDEIAEGNVEWVPTLETFYGPFHQNLETKTKELDRADIMPDRVLGNDPATGMPVILKTGRFGGFIQVGEYSKEDKKAGKPKPKSASLLKGMNVESVTLEQALSCLSLPREVGTMESGEKIVAAVGRFGPYVKSGDVYASIKEPFDPLTIDEATARTLLKESTELKKKMQTPIAEFGTDPVSGGEILLKHGRFGPYLTDGTTNASLGKKRDATEVTRESAIEILEKKRALEAKRGKFKPRRK